MTTTLASDAELTGWLARPDILDEVRRTSWCSVGASAGTGKTHLIEHLVVDVVLSGELPIDRLLVVTYTEKAAGELRQRVRERLRRVLEPDPVQPVSGGAWRIGAREQALAARALASFDGALIGTIHQFCLQALKEHGVLAGLPPGTGDDVVDSPFDEAWRSVLRRRIAEPALERYWSSLPMPRRDEIEQTVRRVAGVREPVLPSLEDLEARAAALLESWRTLGEPSMAQGDAHPFHAHPYVGGRFVTDDLRAYWSFTQNLLDGLALAKDSLDRGRAVMFAAIGPAAAAMPKNNAAFGRVRAGKVKAACHTDEQRAFLLEVDALRDYAVPYAAAALAPDVRAEMRHLHDERGTLTFDEMVWRLRDALASEEDAPLSQRLLLRALRERFALGLIDEFQDTDDRQWDIFRTVFVRAAGEQRRADGGLVVVGDPKQAIYRFRGADVQAYQRAAGEILAAGGGDEVTLDDNWRSTPALLRALDDVFADRLFADEPIAYRPLTARGGYQLQDEEGARPLVLLAPAGVFEQEPQERYSKGELGGALAHGVAAEIRRLLSDACGIRVRDPKRDRRERRLCARDICVLGRSHEDLRHMGRALRRAGVPYAQYKRRGLYATAEALDLLDMLIAVLDPENTNDVMRAFATSFFAIRGDALADVSDLGPDSAEVTLLSSLFALARRGDVPGMLRALEQGSAVIRRLLFCEGERAATNMRHLLDETLRLHAETGWMLPRLVEELRRRVEQTPDEVSEADLLRLESEQDLITLMTMHTSKGLEYPVVFLAGGFKGREQRAPKLPEVLPVGRGSALVLNPERDAGQSWGEANDQENARLLYVAATRAKGKLYLPFWSPRQQGSHLVPGLYRRVRPRLCEIWQQGGNEHVEVREAGRLAARIPPLPDVLDDSVRDALASFTPPRPAPSVESQRRLPRLVSARRGPLQTSYTALERRSGGAAGHAPVEPEPAGTPAAVPLETDFSEQSDDVTRGPYEPPLEALSEDAGRERRAPDEVEVAAANVATPGRDEPLILPGSARVGIAVHNIFEALLGSTTELAALRAAEDPSAWLDGAALEQGAVEQGARGHFAELERLGFDRAQIDATASLLFHTLRRPFHGRAAPGSEELVEYPPFCALEQRLPEVRFYLPIPEDEHPLLRAAEGAPPAPNSVIPETMDVMPSEDDDDLCFRVRRGWLTGSLDLVFRHAGRTCIVDWKTNFLRAQPGAAGSDYRPERVAAHVDEKYRLQVAIYTLAVLRWLGVRDEESYRQKFGGTFYFYLRGSGQADAPPGYGVFHELPRFEQVMRYEDLLRRWPYRRRARGDDDDAVFGGSAP